MKSIIKITTLILAIVLCLGALCSCDIDWDYCQHNLEEIKRDDATCMAVGRKTAYVCTKCGELFAYGYLNGKDGEKGLYPIEHQEMLDYAGHVASDFFGDLKSDMKSFDATSLEDYTVWSHCGVEGCGEAFEVPEYNLVPFAPASNNNGNGEAVVVGENTQATRFPISGGTKAGHVITIYNGKSTRGNATENIPFEANTDRHVVLFFHNDGTQDVTVKYTTEYYGARQGAEVVVPAGGYAPAYFAINLSGTNYYCYHELTINSDVNADFNLTISGFFYNEAKLQTVKVDNYPRTEYAIGETFDAKGLEIIATFGGVERKIDASDYTLVLNNNKPITEPLTEADTKVYVIYQNKQVSFDIRVQRFIQNVTLVGASFADGSTAKELDRGALIPADITASNGKSVQYFIDQYGEKYVPGEGKVPAYNVTLVPIYEGVEISENYALGAEVSVSSTAHGGNKNTLVDGSHGLNGGGDDRWSSKSNYDTATPDEADREWVMIDLGEVKSISQVVVYPRIYGSYFPEAYQILVSENGEDWTTVVTVDYDEQASKNAKLARWNGFESVNAQYVKIVATTMTNDGGSYGYIFQLSEIEIFGEVAE